MRVKLYNKREDRSKKYNKDLHAIISLTDISNYSKNELLNELKEAYLNNPLRYDFGKARLNAFNVHNFGDILKEEFIPTGLIHFDFDKISTNEIEQIKKNLTSAYMFMLSPSCAGLKVFYRIDNLTEKNFKIVYKNFGIKIGEKLNDTFNTDKYTYSGTNSVIDISCNDLNRLCYVGSEFQFIGDEKDSFDANQFYTENEIEEKERIEYKFTNDNSHIIHLANDVASKGIKLVDRFNGFRDLGFSFAHLAKVEKYDRELVLEIFKKVLGEEKTFTTSTGNHYDIDYWFKNLYDSYNESYSAGLSKAITIGHFVELCKKNGITITPKRRTYKLKFVKKGDAIKDYLTDKKIKLASCKYSKNTLLQEKDFYFPLENESVFTEWVNYNDTFINVHSEKKNKDGGINEELLTNIRTDKCESLKVSATEWKAFLTNNITTNEIDTSKLFFESLLNKYTNEELIGLSEINNFFNLFIKFPKNCDSDLTKRKLKTALLSVIDKSLGNKNEWCIVFLSQGEGVGKTELIRKGLFKPFVDFKLHAPFKLTDDEWKSDELLSSIVIAEVDEKGVGQNQTNILKRMVSLDSTFQKDKHSNVNKRRTSRATILFTSNDYKFLKNNQEQNRRFLIFDFGNGSDVKDRLWTLDENKVVRSKFESIDFNKLWAELYLFYKKTERKVDVDFKEIIEDNEKYRVSTSYENRNNTVLQMFVNDVEDKSGTPVMLHASDILLIMQIVAGGNFSFSQKDKNLITQHFTDKEYQREKRTCGLCDDKGTITEKLFNFDYIKLENEEWENKRSMRFIIKIKEEIIKEIKKYKQNLSVTDDFMSDDITQMVSQEHLKSVFKQ